jgi:transposase
MGSTRVELFEAIRRDARREELSIRQLAARHGVHRRTVRTALASPTPPPRKPRASPAPKLDPAKPFIDAMLREDLTAPRKQQHTARRVLGRLLDEHAMTELTYSTVRDYVARRRPEIAAEGGRLLAEVFVPQTHQPGAEAEVDFADLWVDLAGTRTRVFLFTLRLSYSGKAVHRAFGTQGQEAFLEGHAEAFRVLGGVPTVHIRYDNLKSAVSRVLFGRNRVESDRWVLFRSHMGFDAFYCKPGLDGAHEKGGVEGEGGRFRRNHLVPVPKVDSLAELNARLLVHDEADNARRITNRVRTVAEDFAREARCLRPLPAEPFETGLVLTPRVDRHARVTVRQCHYSVPARLIGRRVRVILRAQDLVVLDGRREVARHERSTVRGSATLVLDHYLEVLARKPGALPGATALVQARTAGTFTPAHEAFWAAARTAHGDGAGTRELVEVLLLHRHMHHGDVLDGVTAALRVGAVRADIVAVEARRIAEARLPVEPAVDELAAAAALGAGLEGRVLSLTERRLAEPGAVIAGLPPDPRPLPTVDAYDELLVRRTSAANGSATSSSSKGQVS